ncbi:Uncharacterized conserved protein YndB, AHSA1/START domain [Paenibacillus catalpae]|uniref:Uncharacterized conserved protein YndB, AHSA1/START domain n=1 Tax=Paenibacillus catalpae TaxID=1045775 RepID=A0A1I2DFJ1_9BACL|nr:Uncharacterized conserved protein YndB, AHSA1/START domain [Paenibacillus catalpae]
MLATISQESTGYTVTFERILHHSREEVWSYFTDNEKLPKWFSELRAEDLREGGQLSFNMGDGTYETMMITAYELQSVLAFTWGDDMAVRFEFHEVAGGCRLLLIESIYKPSEHTPKDLAGWHVCLEVIASLLDNGRPLANRREDWKHWYPKYADALQQLKSYVVEVSTDLEQPIAAVWRAITEAEALSQWYSPGSPWEITALREGATALFHHSPSKYHAGTEVTTLQALITAYEPPERFALRWDYTGVNDVPVTTTFRLHEHKGRTTVTMSESGYENAEQAEPVKRGYTMSLANLKAYLEGKPLPY